MSWPANEGSRSATTLWCRTCAPCPFWPRSAVRGDSTPPTRWRGPAGNVARNGAALGGLVALIGVVGNGAAAREALGLIELEAGIEGDLVVDASRSTTVKTRFVSAGQQLLRVDTEDVVAVVGEVE